MVANPRFFRIYIALLRGGTAGSIYQFQITYFRSAISSHPAEGYRSNRSANLESARGTPWAEAEKDLTP
jgi:hypothetical protein